MRPKTHFFGNFPDDIFASFGDRTGRIMVKATHKAFDKKIWLSSPTMHGEELEYMTKAYATNWMSTLGENVDELERGISARLGASHAVALSSGTAALHMAFKLAGVQAGDRVFCSDVTFAATVNPVVYEKGLPVFIDSEYDTWNMDPEALKRGFERYPDTKAVVVANLYGVPAKLDEIKEICNRHGAVLIEDAAESLGARYKGKETGTFGDYNVISFNGNKIITGSSGGMLLTEDGDGANRVRKWSTQSRESAPWYQHEELGYNYRMSNVVAGVARGQLPYLEAHIAKKKEIFERYGEGLKDLPVEMNPLGEDSDSNYWLSCMLIKREGMCKQTRAATRASYLPESGKSCPTEILETLASYNVEGRPIWKPMHLQPIFRGAPFVSREDGVDVGGDIFERGLCLPSDIKMTEEEQEIVIEMIKSCFA